MVSSWPPELTLVSAALLAAFASSVVVDLWLVVLASRRESPASAEFVGLFGTSILWSTSYILVLVSPTFQLARLFDLAYGVLSILIVLFFLRFVIVYTGTDEVFTHRRLSPLYAELFLFSALLATNPFHGLVRTVEPASYQGLTLVAATRSPIARAQVVLIFFALVGGLLLLVWFFFRSRDVFRKQTGVILFAGVLGTTVNAALMAGGSPHPALEVGPLYHPLQGLIIAWALFRYDFLDMTPLATDTLVEAMDDVVLIVDEDDEVFDFNGAATDVLGLSDGDVGRPVSSLLPELQQALETDTPYRPAGRESRATDGGSTIYDPNTTPIHDHHDSYRGELVVLRDVTLQKRREERLNEFASVVSHDLRTPLNLAKGYVQNELKTTESEDLEQALEAMDRMDDLVGDLLVLAREGQAIDSTETIDLSRTANDAWQSVETPDCELVLEETLWFEADRHSCQRLLENLFTNARDHGDASTVRVGSTDRGFYVVDDGRGIPEHDHEAVFEHGYTTDDEGTGLGLSIVERIARAHGWSVTVGRSADGGARFEFSVGKVDGPEE